MGNLDLAKVAYCKIYPPIGIARVGDSTADDGYFFAAEGPDGFIEGPEGSVPHDEFRYRDKTGKVKRQAARFRLYAFDNHDLCLGEITHAHGDIEWSAELANKKAAWFGFFGAEGARSAFRAEEPPRAADGNPLAWRNERFGTLKREAGGPHGHRFVADEKRASALEITGAVRSVSGPNKKHSPEEASSEHLDFVGSFHHATSVYLGELATDAAGRLVVLGGRGISSPVDDEGNVLETPEDKWIVHYANNDSWFDDTSDGPVTAKVNLRATEGNPARDIEVRGGAWIIVAPPDFAPDVTNLVTLYDVMEEVALHAPSLVNPTTPEPHDPQSPDLERDIWPIIARSAGYRWVSQTGLRGHGQGKPGDGLSMQPETVEGFRESLKKGGTQIRDKIVKMIRPPNYPGPDGRRPVDVDPEAAKAYANASYMPPLSGDEGDCETGAIDNWLTVTYAQYCRLKAWNNHTDPFLYPAQGAIDPYLEDGSLHPALLTRRVLERCAGGAFYPGIEATAIVRDPALYSEAFRFEHDHLEAGDITKYMACPWQADFYECRGWWWPAQRPDDVVLEDEFKEIFAEFTAETTGSLAGTLERALMMRAPWDRSVGEASPRPSGKFRVDRLFALSSDQRDHEGAESFVTRTAGSWARMIIRQARPSGNPWRQQFLLQEFLDTYSGRYLHLRAAKPDEVLSMVKIRESWPELVKKYQISTFDDLHQIWRDAIRDEEAATSLDEVSAAYIKAALHFLAEQVSKVLSGHPSYPGPSDKAKPGSAAKVYDALTDFTEETVDRINQAHTADVRIDTPIFGRFRAVELRDAMMDLGYVANIGRNGDNGMVQDWRRLGFVVQRTVKVDDEKSITVQVETERRKYDGANPRDQFYALMNIQDFPDFPEETIRIVERGLSYAQSVIDSITIDDEDHPESAIAYSQTAFRAKLDEIYEILRARAQNFELFYELCSINSEDVRRRILDRAPFNQTDGAWLRHIAEAGPGDEVRSLLFEVWSDEIGNGDPALHHGNLYTALLDSLGMRLPGVTTLAYANNPNIPAEAYINPVFQLAISLNSDRYYPELLGMTLFLEWEVLSLQTGVMRNDYLGIDTQFWEMHIGIDNATNGHGAKARDAIIMYLDKIRKDGGDDSVQEHWDRIWRGFVAFNVVGGSDYGDDTSIARRRPGNAASTIAEVMQRKRHYGSQNHLGGRIGPHRINDLFDDPDLFQAVLANSRWVVPGDPERSQLINYLTTFEGPMYKIFDANDLTSWQDWIRWLGREGDTAVIKRYFDKGQAMEKLLYELRAVAQGATSHRRYKLSSGAGREKKSVADLFADGDVIELMRALKDPDNGWIVPGHAEESPLLVDVARSGRPMGDALDERFSLINNRIGRQIVIEWVRAGCPIPGEPLPGEKQVAEPPKSLGPKLLLHTHGIGEVH
ncbi:hypothetical protein AS026_29190 [Rhizobium altiplani]|uniref:Uncharacterized protein n=1 Tax=Rhizobium altiplani TaxID=1864509 RepID=A0A120FQX1_9HYPH|nr:MULTISPECIES: LodA/GoxA family CTQ-dependent oxidase [Rhizobium]KWV59179.1 hypothetical protein AS026_29190 [Rhizobium altiplani]